MVPSLYEILSTICAHSDHRNQHKHSSAHWPSICMAAAILLNGRSREMCGLQGVLSLLLFASRVDKLLFKYTAAVIILLIFRYTRDSIMLVCA